MNEITRRRFVGRAGTYALGGIVVGLLPGLVPARMSAAQRAAAPTGPRRDWLALTTEPALEPELPIIDPHHHLWDRSRLDLRAMPFAAHGFSQMLRERSRYMLDELLADTDSGHDIRATVFIECRAMYRADGPKALRSVGETEFVNGVAAIRSALDPPPWRAGADRRHSRRQCAAGLSHCQRRRADCLPRTDRPAQPSAGAGL